MTPLVTADQMRAVEAAEFARGTTEPELSDRAAAALADRLKELLPRGGTVLCIAGLGNNGLDAVKVHTLLGEAGVPSMLHCWKREDCPTESSPQTLAQTLARAAVVLDGLFGIGLRRNVEGEAAEILKAVARERARRRDLLVVALDVPSGLNSDTGAIMGTALRADITITLGLPKIGLYTSAGPSTAGDIWRESIGLDAQELADAEAQGFDSTGKVEIPPRQVGSHKNQNGRLLVIGGSLRYPGAPVLAARAAHRLGAGYVTVGFPRSMLGVIASRLLAETLLPLPESDIGSLGPPSVKDAAAGAHDYKALLLGNGIGREKETQEFVLALLGVESTVQRRSVGFRAGDTPSSSAASTSELPPTVIDGDGLTALASHESWWESTPSVQVLTPHPGEMATLLGKEVEEVEAERIPLAREAASRWGRVVLLKGSYPLVASPDGSVQVLTESHPELGTAGTGDVLAGVCGYLLSVGLEPSVAARTALVIGARAGRLASQQVGRDAVGPEDLIAAMPRARLGDER